MSGTARSSARSTASGRIKTENPALVKLLTGDSLTNTRFVESTSPVQSQHAFTKINEDPNSVKKTGDISTDKNSNNRPNSRHSQVGSGQKESRPNSKYSVKSESKSVTENSKESSWGNIDETLTFDVTKTVTEKSRENTLTLGDNFGSGHKSPAIIKSGHNTPSKIDYLQVERAESPNFERTRSREDNRTPGGTSQSYSTSRLKNQPPSGKEHPNLLARSASQLIDSQGVGFEGDSLDVDVDSGLVPDSASFVVSAPDTGRQTYRVPTPIKSDDIPVIESPSRYRSNSAASHRSTNSATGVPPPDLDRNPSIVSDNGIPPPSNLNLSGRVPEAEQEDSVRPDLRKSAVSFKEPVISGYHSHTEVRETSDWDTPRVPTPHPSSPPKFHDSLDFESGRASNLSPEPTHQEEADIPSALFTQGDLNNSAKSSKSVKKVYIDSPTFTKEEEEEFRFVESRLDDMNEDLEDTVRRIEEQGNRYRQEREAMNEEAARLRAEIQATEGYSNSYNRNNYSDNHSKPIAHPTEEMDQHYGRDQDYGQQNGYGYGNLRDSRDVYNTRNDRYEDRNKEEIGFGINQDRYQPEQEDYSRNQYSQDQGGYSQNQGGYSQNQGGYSQNQGGYSQNQGGYSQNQGGYSENQGGYNQGQGGYSQNQGRYERDMDMQEQNGYSRRPNNQYNDQYGGQQNDQYYDRRGDSPSRYPQNDNPGDDDLQRETEYQEDLRHRVESNQKHDSEIVIPRIPVTEESYRDSLDENAQRNFARDSLDQENYGNWGNPPPNPFGQGRDENAEYLERPNEKRPDYVDDNDTARMELLHPKEPKVDYVEENKFTYGLPPNKTYKTIKIKEKEAEQKLHEVFVHPKKPGKKHKRTIPLSNEERRPPLTELRENEGGAEDVWAKRSAQLAKHKDGKVTASGTVKKSRGLQKFPSESAVNSSQGQIYPGQGRMYGTPTRNQYLEPLGYKPQMSKEDPQQSPAYREGSYKKPLELAPIKTEITTDDGQKISVDINLKVLSPTLQRRIKSHPDDAPNSEPPFNVHAEVKQNRHGDRRPVGMQYQPSSRDQPGADATSRHSPQSRGSRQYPVDNHDTRSYQVSV